ncbi:MAG: hypothetical protein EOP83_06115 [Verrucomicrobiaceae bacterium]|nr:MAG: hypothetical protein EOP83_06115 [Verrucomicrobiaceae bacterium]
MQKPPKYITNKDLLREIHRSKVTFCSFIDPQYTDYDLIVSDLKDVTPELLAEVLHKKQNPRGKIQPTQIFTLDDLVIRHMTHEHIPLDPDRKRKARNTDVSYARTNFPPYKHYIVRDGEMKEVCRSHWSGGFDNGHFELDGGRLTNNLAVMFMMLVERYSRRGNWRGYTYVDEMRSHALLQLSQVGLQFDESKGDNPFAFFTTTIHNCFTRVLNVEKRNQNIRDDMLIVNGVTPSYTRQIENEIEQRFPSDNIVTTKPKRGAPRRKTVVRITTRFKTSAQAL